MWYQLIGLFLDIVGVALLAWGGVFPVKNKVYIGGKWAASFSSKDILLARIGLSLAIVGFLFQMVGVILTGSISSR